MDEKDKLPETGQLPPETDAAQEQVSVEPAPVEPTVEGNTMPEGEDGPREKVIALLKELDPEVSITDDASLMEAIYSRLSQLSNFQNRLMEVMEEFPEFGDVLEGIVKGMSPPEAIARYFDPESMAPPEGAPDFEAISKAKDDRRKQVEEKNLRKKQLTDNEQVSIENVKKFREENGWDESKTVEFLNSVEKLNADMFDGKISLEHLEVLKKGFGYDDMVAAKDEEIQTAAEDGRIAGMNEKIAQKRAGKEKSDGLPRLSNTGPADKTTPKVSLVNQDLPSKKLKFK